MAFHNKDQFVIYLKYVISFSVFKCMMWCWLSYFWWLFVCLFAKMISIKMDYSVTLAILNHKFHFFFTFVLKQENTRSSHFNLIIMRQHWDLCFVYSLSFIIAIHFFFLFVYVSMVYFLAAPWFPLANRF